MSFPHSPNTPRAQGRSAVALRRFSSQEASGARVGERAVAMLVVYIVLHIVVTVFFFIFVGSKAKQTSKQQAASGKSRLKMGKRQASQPAESGEKARERNTKRGSREGQANTEGDRQRDTEGGGRVPPCPCFLRVLLSMGQVPSQVPRWTSQSYLCCRCS